MQATGSLHPSLCVDSEDSVLISVVMVRWCVTWHTDNMIYAEAKRILLHVYCHLAVVNAVRCIVGESEEIKYVALYISLAEAVHLF